MPFTAGDQIRGPQLRAIFPLIGYAPGDVEISNSIDIEPISGAQVIVEPRTEYAIAGYIAYDAAAASDIAIYLATPPRAVGHWGMYRLDGTATTTSVGDVLFGRANSIGTDQSSDDNYCIAAGSSVSGGAQVAYIRGWLSTGNTGGAFQAVFVQGAPTTDLTVIKAGSWIKLTKLK